MAERAVQVRHAGDQCHVAQAIENNKVRGVEFGTLERLAAFYEVGSICDLLELSEISVEKEPPAS
jgi:hypothetical protein